MLDRCTRCVYDRSLSGITFDASGVCNYCRLHDQFDQEYPIGADGELRLQEIAKRVAADGKGKRYDVVVGVSGGCDSSYMLYLSKHVLGLRPLAVHFDNTWNTRTAVENIRKVLSALDVDLSTYVVDNAEYDDLYRSFLRAGVPDFDAQTDLGLAAVLYRTAEEHGIHYVFEGHSFRTEGISPLGWMYMDGRYVSSVHARYGTRPLRTYPNMTLRSMLKWTSRIEKIRPLYYLDYHKASAMSLLERELGWKWYGGHHLENQGSAFAHTYYWPRRYGLDTRMLGLAALVRSGQASRADALTELAKPREYDPDLIAMVQKRLEFTDAEFERLMEQPRRTYRDFDSYKRTFERLRLFFWLLYKLGRVPKSFYVKYTRPDPVMRSDGYARVKLVPVRKTAGLAPLWGGKEKPAANTVITSR